MATQLFPWPANLEAIVKAASYRPGWSLRLYEDFPRDYVDEVCVSSGPTLVITTVGHDSYHIDRGPTYRVNHLFPIPPATYNDESWRRWLFDCILKVETHEACEFFEIDGIRPYAPNHGPGNDPYIIRELTTDEARRTSFRGDVKDA